MIQLNATTSDSTQRYNQIESSIQWYNQMVSIIIEMNFFSILDSTQRHNQSMRLNSTFHDDQKMNQLIEDDYDQYDHN
ncbi:unnamed protein product [Rotaria sordida]|uniref:Uncharacterized protein n=1 Tax=Rotaria sordida TaxID=392033 RepID=A0A819TZV5_9BILA|nr:unnamed protein product [Rotaria sordida]CAF3988018.1 unnamed protein product [Rotaria sordida]CAF4086479.1 unnamed protein product [Rotaria sordida]